jgi:hypothetical protein
MWRRKAGFIPTTLAAGSGGIPDTISAAACGRGRAADQAVEGDPPSRGATAMTLRARRSDLPLAAAPGFAALGLRQPPDLNVLKVPKEERQARDRGLPRSVGVDSLWPMSSVSGSPLARKLSGVSRRQRRCGAMGEDDPIRVVRGMSEQRSGERVALFGAQRPNSDTKPAGLATTSLSATAVRSLLYRI